MNPKSEGIESSGRCSLNCKLLSGEPINESLKAHTLSPDIAGWAHRELLQTLHEWADIFVLEFDLGLEIPALRVDRLSVRRLGQYRPGRNGLGLQHEITINSRHLKGALARLLTTELHELLHEWQALFGKAGRGNYHNRQFRQKAGLYGLVVDARGHTLVEPGRFTAVLSKYGVDLSSLRSPEDIPVVGRRIHGNSKQRKWRCGCTTVRCAVELAAHCDKCGARFQEAAPSW